MMLSSAAAVASRLRLTPRCSTSKPPSKKSILSPNTRALRNYGNVPSATRAPHEKKNRAARRASPPPPTTTSTSTENAPPDTPPPVTTRARDDEEDAGDFPAAALSTHFTGADDALERDDRDYEAHTDVLPCFAFDPACLAEFDNIAAAAATDAAAIRYAQLTDEHRTQVLNNIVAMQRVQDESAAAAAAAAAAVAAAVASPYAGVYPSSEKVYTVTRMVGGGESLFIPTRRVHLENGQHFDMYDTSGRHAIDVGAEPSHAAAVSCPDETLCNGTEEGFASAAAATATKAVSFPSPLSSMGPVLPRLRSRWIEARATRVAEAMLHAPPPHNHIRKRWRKSEKVVHPLGHTSQYFAKRGEVTEEMAFVAARENVTPEFVMLELRSGRAVLPGNVHHPELEPMIIGRAFGVKINARIGSGERSVGASATAAFTTAADVAASEVQKLKWATLWGADTVSDPSTGAHLATTRHALLRRSPGAYEYPMHPKRSPQKVVPQNSSPPKKELLTAMCVCLCARQRDAQCRSGRCLCTSASSAWATTRVS